MSVEINNTEKNKPNVPQDKKKWKSPEINTWEYSNLEFQAGGINDGTGRSYN